MYPADELAKLQRQKLWRVERSAELRGEITSACATLAYPVGLAERLIITAKKFAPYLSLASFFIRKKRGAASSASGKPSAFHTVLRWAPTLLNAFKLFRTSRQSTTTSSHASS